MSLLLVLAATSLFSLGERESEREYERTGILTVAPSPTDLLMQRQLAQLRGEQFPVVYVEPTDPGRQPVLPPGLSELPPRGHLVVSPALDRLIEGSSRLDQLLRDRHVMDPVGVRTGGEFFAYARPRDPTPLIDGHPDFVKRVASFGASPGVGYFNAGLIEDSPSAPTIVGAFILVVGPAALLLAAAVGTASPLREGRLQVLGWLGASAHARLMLVCLETAILALPGIVAAALLWTAISTRLESVPIVGRRVFAGDLELSPRIAAGVAVVWLVAASVVAALLSLRRIRAIVAEGPRPVIGREQVSSLRLLPLGVGLLLIVLSRFVHGERGSLLLLLGVALGVVGIPLALAGVLQSVGNLLASFTPVYFLLAGRRLCADPRRAGRAMGALGVLVFVSISAAGYVTVVRQVDRPSTVPDARLSAVQVTAMPLTADGVSGLAGDLRGTLVVPVIDQPAAVQLGIECSQLAPFVPAACDTSGALTEAGRAELASLVGAPGDARPIELVGGAVAPAVPLTRTVVIGDRSTGLTDRVQAAALRRLTLPGLAGEGTVLKRESPLVRWLLAGLLSGLLICISVLVLTCVDRFIRGARDHLVLVSLGLTSGRLAGIEARQFLASYVATVGLGAVLGAVVAWEVTSADAAVDFPLAWVAALLAGALCVGLVSSLAAGSISRVLNDGATGKTS